MGNKRYFGNLNYMARELGIRQDYLKDRIMKMAEFGIVIFTDNDITLQDSFDEICFFDPDNKVKVKIADLAEALLKKFEVPK
jgi:alpha-N-acetylglucosamine transferase